MWRRTHRSEYDCGTGRHRTDEANRRGRTIEELAERLLGRVVLEDVYDPYTDEIIAFANEEINEEKAERIKNAGIERVKIRSVLTCESKRGVCVLCYGRDLARGHMVQGGEAVGIIAAQAIGEPGTQLTMRTFQSAARSS
jgi:DNA-directed RNA polymerase subunit beta'